MHRLSIPEIVAHNIAHDFAAEEFRPTSATLRATNFFVYPPSATFRAIVCRKFQLYIGNLFSLALPVVRNPKVLF